MFAKRMSAVLASLPVLCVTSALSQEIPSRAEQVAEPGGELPGNPEISLVKFAEGFEDPINVANAGDGSGRIFVVERAGRVKIANSDGSINEEPFLDLTTLLPSTINPLGNDVQSEFIEQGLYSIAFHPNYEENGYFYVHYSSLRANGDGVIVRFQVDPANADVVSAERAGETAKMLMRIEQPSYNNNGGQLEFGPDGYLYIGVGDGGWDAPRESSQDLSSRLGTILRIDVNTGDEDVPYVVPMDNPFAESASAPKNEIWAYGFHNPYEFAFDQVTGDLFISDVGDSSWEEINYQSASSSGGENYGWSRMEGSHCYPIIGSTGDREECEIFGNLPAAQYPHPGEDVERDQETGALPCASAQGFGVANYGGMKGVYLLGDWCSGRVYGLGWDGTRWQLQQLLQTDLHFTAGGYDQDGNVLVLSAKFYADDKNPDVPP